MKRFLFVISAAGLALVMLHGACHAIRWSWDYTAYRVKVYMNDGSEFGVQDVNNMDRKGIIDWLLYAGPKSDYPKYEKIAEGPMTDYEFPPSRVTPVGGVSNPWEYRLKYGDVIICDDHEGVVQPDGTIAHFLRPVPVYFQYDAKGLPQHWCPEPDKPHEYDKSPGWRKDSIHPDDPAKDIPSCCGEFKGDTWKEFLTRSGNPRLPALCSIYREKDTDKDTVPDRADKCAATPWEERGSVYGDPKSKWYGCSRSERDLDEDGIMDNLDKCDTTPKIWVKRIDTNRGSKWYGCAPCEIDEDGDKVLGNGSPDCPEKCPGTLPGEVVDEHGCSVRQLLKLRIDADDRAEAGAVIRFTAVLDRISAAELPSGGLSYEWKVNGETAEETIPTISRTVPKNYDKPEMTAEVKLKIITPKLQTLESDPVWKAVTITKPRKVELVPVGKIEDKVGASVTLEARVDGSPMPPKGTGTHYGHYWFENDVEKERGIDSPTHKFTVPKGGLRAKKKVSVLVKESRGGKPWQDVLPGGKRVYFDFTPYYALAPLGKVSMKVACVPSVAPPGTSVRCAANVENPDDLKKLSELVSAGGRWGYYWYVNNSAQNFTGASIPVTIPKTGGAEVVARLMVTDPTATATPRYDADYGGAGPIGPQLQEAGRAGATLQAQSAGPRTGGSTTKTYGPFAVPWGSWFSTGVQIKKGESFSVKATGAYRSVNQNTDVKTCGPGGCGPWGWFVLKAKIGSQMMDVKSSGGGTANQDGVIELGSPRGGTFVKEDAGNCTGSLSVEVWVEQKR